MVSSDGNLSTTGRPTQKRDSGMSNIYRKPRLYVVGITAVMLQGILGSWSDFGQFF
jgi:hypothetical protein